MAREGYSTANLVVYVHLGVVGDAETTIADVEVLVGEMRLTTRHLYGLQFVDTVSDIIGKFVQTHETQVQQQYFVAEPWKGSRIYAQESAEGVYLFMVTAKDDTHESNFEQLISQL